MTSNTSATTASIAALLEIMGNEGETMRRRLESAATLLTYETSEQIVEWTKAFLVAVLEDRKRVRTDHRLEAAQLLRKAEAPKISQQSVRADDAARRSEMWREAAIGRRRLALDRAGLWPAPDGWCDDLMDPAYEPGPPRSDRSA